MLTDQFARIVVIRGQRLRWSYFDLCSGIDDSRVLAMQSSGRVHVGSFQRGGGYAWIKKEDGCRYSELCKVISVLIIDNMYDSGREMLYTCIVFYAL